MEFPTVYKTAVEIKSDLLKNILHSVFTGILQLFILLIFLFCAGYWASISILLIMTSDGFSGLFQKTESGFQLDIRSAKCQIQCCIWGRRWSRLSSPHLAPLLLVHCFLCLTDVRHAATGSVPEMLQWEETEGSRGISQVWREISPWTEVSASLHAGNDRLKKKKRVVGLGSYAFRDRFSHISQLSFTYIDLKATIRFLALAYTLFHNQYSEVGYWLTGNSRITTNEMQNFAKVIKIQWLKSKRLGWIALWICVFYRTHLWMQVHLCSIM